MTTSSHHPVSDQISQMPSVKIDYRRLIFSSLKYWYVILALILLGLGFAHYQARYRPPQYVITSSVIVRDSKENNGGELLYKNPLINPYRNYFNEPYIIRSYPFIKQVVDEMNIAIAFYRQGFVLTSDAYDYIPVKPVLIELSAGLTSETILEIIDRQKFSLEEKISDDKKVKTIFSFGDTVLFQSNKFVISLIKDRSIDEFIKKPYSMTITDPTQLAIEYMSRLGVKWVEPGSSVLELSITGSNPQKEVDFLNTLFKKYQSNDFTKKNQSADRTINFIKSQLAQISDSLKGFEYKLEEFKNKNPSANIGLQAQQIFAKMEPMELQKTELLVKKSYYDYIESYVKKEQDLDQVIPPSSVGITDAVVSGLISKMIDNQLELKVFMGKERLQNPLSKQKMERLDEIKRDIVESIYTLRKTDKIKLDFLEGQIKKIEKQLEFLPLAERQLVSIKRNYGLLENLYVFLMQKMSEADISRASNISDITLVNPPMPRNVGSSDGKNYVIYSLVALSIPFIFFMLVQVFDVKIQSKEDIEKITALPFMGGVGRSNLKRSLIVYESPKSGVAESFRSLRSNLNFFTGNKSKKVFLISSSISGEGKTFTTTNLATVFALSQRKTLIIGADMRRPKIFSDFDLSNAVGLSSYLSDLNSLPEVIQKTKIDNLFLISGGPVPPNPAELLLTDRFDKLIQEALLEFDFIIIDTPPMALVTDAFVMSRVADVSLFVVRQNYSNKAFIRNIDEYYTSGRVKNVSIVLNDIYKSGAGYGYGYGYGYENYGSRTKKKNGYGYYEG